MMDAKNGNGLHDVDEVRTSIIENVEDLVRVAHRAAEIGELVDSGVALEDLDAEYRRLRRALVPFIGPMTVPRDRGRIV